MKELRRLWVVVPAVVLVALVVLLFVNRGAMEQLAFLKRGQAGGTGLVDQRPYQTAQTLSGMAVSAEEQSFARDAERLADHEVNQAFAMALKLAELEQKPLKGEAAALAAKVFQLQAAVKADQAQVDSLTSAAKAAGTVPAAAAGGDSGTAGGDDLEVAQAQLGLDQDELADAQGDLARATGDKRGEIQQELAAREAAMKQAPDAGGTKKTAVAAARQFGTLAGRVKAWFAQRDRAALLAQAEASARSEATELQAEHNRLESAGASAAAAVAGASGSDRVKLLKALAARRVVMSTLDDRVATDQQLASIYSRWQAQVWVQHHIVGYLLLQSFSWVTLIVLIAAVGVTLARMAVRRMVTEARERRTMETIVTLAVEVAALLAVGLVVFGTPQQMPTILGFATAAVTVVFQDFILAFFGWFSLMGKHGIRVGDWVEINSVAGEVAEISLFRTVLLETGNWTTKGHPTGRRMSFSNSFALKGQFFNFSTNGQWMWDELSVNVPATANAYELIKQVQAAVDEQTASDTAQAELEWQRVAKDIGVGQFGAKPTVELRPAATGVDVVVRFVTRASERFALRAKVNEVLVGLMGGAEKTGETTTTATAS
jgi:small-conductance mechanosensitive channel